MATDKKHITDFPRSIWRNPAAIEFNDRRAILKSKPIDAQTQNHSYYRWYGVPEVSIMTVRQTRCGIQSCFTAWGGRTTSSALVAKLTTW